MEEIAVLNLIWLVMVTVIDQLSGLLYASMMMVIVVYTHILEMVAVKISIILHCVETLMEETVMIKITGPIV